MFSFFTDKFRKYDYGHPGNMKKYDEAHLRDYNLGNISLAVYLYYGTNDVVIDAQVCIALIANLQLISNFLNSSPLLMVLQGVQKLYETLPNGQKSLVQSDNFAHLDFLLENNVNTLVYSKILNFMKQHRK